MTLPGPVPSVRLVNSVTSHLIAVFPAMRVRRPQQQADSLVFRAQRISYSTRLPKLARQLRQARARIMLCLTRKSAPLELIQTAHRLQKIIATIANCALMDTLAVVHQPQALKQHAKLAFGAV